MGDDLKHKLATLAISIGTVRAAPFYQKAALAEVCLVQSLDLLGALVQRIEKLEGRDK